MVSGRALHEFLEVKTPYVQWFERMTEYGFIEGTHHYTILCDGDGFGKSASRTDHAMRIDMAKELSMLARTDKGKQARQYFIQLEKAWNSPETVMARALKIAERKLSEKDTLIAALLPKAEFFDAVADSGDAIDIGSAAKVLNMGIGRNALFGLLRSRGVLMTNNQPYQSYIDKGYFRTIEQKYSKSDGSTHINIKTLVYQKGLQYIRRVVKSEAPCAACLPQ